MIRRTIQAIGTVIHGRDKVESLSDSAAPDNISSIDSTCRVFSDVDADDVTGGHDDVSGLPPATAARLLSGGVSKTWPRGWGPGAMRTAGVT